MLGLFDYPKTEAHPGVQPHRCGSTSRTAEATTPGFRFVGSEGVMTVDNGVTLQEPPPLKDPGYTLETFPKAMQEAVPEGVPGEVPGRGAEE